jgi:ribonuclease HI
MLQTVADLINPITGSWDEDLIRQNFWTVDVTRILEIPLSPTGMEDFVAWHWTKSGLFTVRSAYHAEWEYQFGRHNPNVMDIGGSRGDDVWKKLWCLHLPAKIKIFGWRLLHGLIPCYGVLANRHIGTSSQCPICKIHCEDILHMTFTCQRAQQVWQRLGIADIINSSLTERSGSMVIQHMILNLGLCSSLNNIGLPELILTGAWYLWWERRQFTHGEALQIIHRSAMSIGVLATNYWKAKKHTIINKKESWTRPMEGVLKINVDAAYDEDQGRGSIGTVVRDYTGKFIYANCKELLFVADPFMAEAYALREGLSAAQFLGGNQYIIQSDNSQVIDTMNDGGFSATSSAAIFDDCRILAAGYINISFEHCRREANEAAHEIARFCFENRIDCIWDDEPPSFLLPRMINDVTVI